MRFNTSNFCTRQNQINVVLNLIIILFILTILTNLNGIKNINRLVDDTAHNFFKAWITMDQIYPTGRLSLKNGKLLKLIRGSNYRDRTLTIQAKDVVIIVGNETVDSNLKAITVHEYLSNYGKYTPGIDDEIDLSSGYY